mmetsp:Transcript_16823/g.19075  ORF Transcript_16823/g.19075 Transcript_16823/m.19075 type:complete len:110 (-) Transcript_16823:1607-1936(-)
MNSPTPTKESGTKPVLLRESAVHSECSKTFIIKGEDHTLGNSLRYTLMRDPAVMLCGYTIPHPMEDNMNMRIQTMPEKTADKALEDGLESLISICQDVKKEFSAALSAS